MNLLIENTDTAIPKSKLINTVAWASLAFTVVACFWSNAPNWLLFLICLAILAVIAVSIWFQSKSINADSLWWSAYDGLFLLIFLAPAGLAIKAMDRFELVNWEWPLIAAVAIGVPALLALFRTTPVLEFEIRHFFAVIVFTFCGPGALIWSGLQFVNDIKNSNPVATYRIQISAKHEQPGKRTLYWINATNPPSLNGIEDFKLDWVTYDTLSVGGAACVNVWQGTLGLRWYKVTQCQTTTTFIDLMPQAPMIAPVPMFGDHSGRQICDYLGGRANYVCRN